MALMDKSKMLAFAKQTANPPLAAVALNKKKEAAKGVAAAPGAPKAMHPPSAPGVLKPALALKKPPASTEGEEPELYIHELVEQAAQEAEAGQDQDLEDAVAGYTSKGAEDVPSWAEDATKWKEASDAVGLGTPETEDRYDEPFVVAAYLYKKLGGSVKGLENSEVTEMPEEASTDMAQPGAAAKAIHAKMKAAVPSAPNSDEGDLKQMVDSAAAQASETPDPEIQGKLQAEPPQEGTPPSWAPDAEKWMKSETAVKPHWANYPDPFLVVAHIYKNMGGVLQ